MKYFHAIDGLGAASCSGGPGVKAGEAEDRCMCVCVCTGDNLNKNCFPSVVLNTKRFKTHIHHFGSILNLIATVVDNWVNFIMIKHYHDF